MHFGEFFSLCLSFLFLFILLRYEIFGMMMSEEEQRRAGEILIFLQRKTLVSFYILFIYFPVCISRLAVVATVRFDCTRRFSQMMKKSSHLFLETKNYPITLDEQQCVLFCFQNRHCLRQFGRSSTIFSTTRQKKKHTHSRIPDAVDSCPIVPVCYFNLCPIDCCSSSAIRLEIRYFLFSSKF